MLRTRGRARGSTVVAGSSIMGGSKVQEDMWVYRIVPASTVVKPVLPVKPWNGSDS